MKKKIMEVNEKAIPNEEELRIAVNEVTKELTSALDNLEEQLEELHIEEIEDAVSKCALTELKKLVEYIKEHPTTEEAYKMITKLANCWNDVHRCPIALLIKYTLQMAEIENTVANLVGIYAVQWCALAHTSLAMWNEHKDRLEELAADE